MGKIFIAPFRYDSTDANSLSGDFGNTTTISNEGTLERNRLFAPHQPMTARKILKFSLAYTYCPGSRLTLESMSIS